MAKKNGRRRSPEEAARREKIRELLEMAGVSGMDDIQQLFRETVAEFMENGLDSELDEHLGYDRYDTKEKRQTTAGTVTAAKRSEPASETQPSRSPGIGKASSIR